MRKSLEGHAKEITSLRWAPEIAVESATFQETFLLCPSYINASTRRGGVALDDADNARRGRR